MPQGIVVYDTNGAILCDTSTKMSKVAAIVDVTAALSGSAQIAVFSGGTPFAIFCQTAGPEGFVRFSFSGSTFSWWKENNGTYFTPDLSTIRGYFVIGSY